MQVMMFLLSCFMIEFDRLT